MQNDNVIVPLHGMFSFPRGFVSDIGLVQRINWDLFQNGFKPKFVLPRFVGFYVQDDVPIGVAGLMVVKLSSRDLCKLRLDELDHWTKGQQSIIGDSKTIPGFVLILDSYDGSCHLWSFPEGIRFLQSTEPVIAPYLW